MSLRTVQVGSLPYTYSPDDSLPVGRRPWGVISGLVVDEITGRAPNSLPFISTSYRGLEARTTQDGGIVGLLGIPENVFPRLQSQPYTVEFMVGAEGYITRLEKVTLPARSTFPSEFMPITLPDLELHRLPVDIRGRTSLVAGAGTIGLEDASVQVTGYWPTAASTTGVAQPANILWLDPPLYFSRTAAAGILRRCEITPVAGEDKTLLLDAVAGSSTLRLSDGVGTVAGGAGVLIVDADDEERMEYLTVSAVVGASTPDQPVTVTLTGPLAYAHRAGVKVSRGNVGPVLPAAPGGFTKRFIRDALPGDGVVFLDDMANVGDATVVEVTDDTNPPNPPTPSNPREFHRFRLYDTESKANGYFSLPPISRVAQLRIAVTHPDHPPNPTDPPLSPRLLSIRYGLGENRIDFVFRR